MKVLYSNWLKQNLLAFFKEYLIVFFTKMILGVSFFVALRQWFISYVFFPKLMCVCVRIRCYNLYNKMVLVVLSMYIEVHWFNLIRKKN